MSRGSWRFLFVRFPCQTAGGVVDVRQAAGDGFAVDADLGGGVHLREPAHDIKLHDLLIDHVQKSLVSDALPVAARLALPKELEHLTRSDWERVTDEGILDQIDQQIVKLYIVRRLPQMDAAAEIGVDRKTISRRLPHIYNIARRLVGKTDKEKAP